MGAYLSHFVFVPSLLLALFPSRSHEIIQKLHFYFHCYSKLLIYNTNKIILDLERGRPQVWQVSGVLREEDLGLVVGDRRMDDDVVTLLPVDGGGDAVLVTDLEGYVHVCEYVIQV